MRHLFVSDLHLDGSSPATAEAFLRFLSAEARDATSLHILGDLFETWIGDDDPDPVRDRVCRALRALGESGVAIYVMQGNRDFLYGREFEQRSGCSLLPDPVVLDLCGERVLLTHGDLLCTDDHAYQELRSTMRSAGFRERVLALPIDARQLLANAARAGSKAHLRTTAAHIMDVAPQAVVAAFVASGTRKMIHGHTHRPNRHTHVLRTAAEEYEAERVVLAAWDERGEYLEVTLREGGSTPEWRRCAVEIALSSAIRSENETPDRAT
ncbi:MAG: UDP-2,3-diacylglucosamine diphosphatase [Gammaproteobacteria bacterium]|nr:UDP-2,3-diacylglucosamine diphosphatase [Gammaproteobacteria bacterium]